MRPGSIPFIGDSVMRHSRRNRRSDCLLWQRRGKRWGCLTLMADACRQGADLRLSRVRGLRSGRSLFSCLFFPETISCLGTGFGSSDLIAAEPRTSRLQVLGASSPLAGYKARSSGE